MNNQKIQQQIENLKQIITGANEKITELEQQLQEQEQEQINTRWKPNINEQYFYIDEGGNVDFHYWHDDEVDNFLSSIGNFYETEEEAEKIGLRKVFKQQLFTKLKEFADTHNETEIDWNNSNQFKYYIDYDYEDNNLSINWCCYCKLLQQDIVFTSYDIAEQAIEEFKDGLIRYYTEVI